MFDGETTRVAALSNRVPTAVLVLEILGSALALGLLGAYLAIVGRGVLAVLLASVLVAFLLLVTADLDRPTRGMIQVPDTVLKNQLASMEEPPAATAPPAMSDVWAAVIVIAVTALAIAAMLFVRRRAPHGSYFEDGDRAAGVFGVLSTGFAVLVGFVVFLAFESYDTSRSGAEAEAHIVAEQFETVQFLPAPAPTDCLGSSSVMRETSCTRNGRK